MENFKGGGLAELGKGLNPYRIKHAEDQLTGFTAMPRPKTNPLTIVYNPRNKPLSDHDAFVRGKNIADRWFDEAMVVNNGMTHAEIVRRATMWAAGLTTVATSIGLVVLNR